MLKSLGIILLAGFAVYGLLCGYLYLIQRSILYYPTPPTKSTKVDSFTYISDNHALEVFIARRHTSQAVVYFGGNAEDVSLSVDTLALLFPDHTIFLPSYRGYGNSEGKPSEKALLTDGLKLYDQLSKEYPDITLFGRSLGSGIAVHIASRRPVTSLILATPYDSLTNVASHYYPFIPVRLLLHDRFDSLGKAHSIDIPTLVLIAEHDEVIPRRNSEQLAAALKKDKTTITVIPGTNHNTIDLSPAYRQAIQTFMQSAP